MGAPVPTYPDSNSVQLHSSLSPQPPIYWDRLGGGGEPDSNKKNAPPVRIVSLSVCTFFNRYWFGNTVSNEVIKNTEVDYAQFSVK